MQEAPIDNPMEDAVIGATVDRIADLPAGDDQPTHFTARTYGLIALLGALAGMGPLAIDFYLPSFPSIARDLHSDMSAVERTLAVYFIGLSLGQLFYGPAADRLGRRRPLIFGLVLFVAASIGCATAKSVDALVAWRFLQALGGCAEMVIARAIVRDKFQARDAARVFSLLMLVMGLAPIVGPLIGGWIVVHLGWRQLFWMLAAFGVACFVAINLLLPETLAVEHRQRQSPSDILRTATLLFSDRTFMVHAAGASLGSAALFAYVAGSSFVIIQLLGLSPGHFGYVFGANAAGLITCAQVNGWMVKRYDPAAVLRGGLAAETLAGCVLLAAALTGFGGFFGIVIPLFAMVSSLGFIFPNTGALAMAPHGRIAGNASAIFGCMQFGVSGIAGFLVSALDNGTAVPMAGLIAGFSAAALLINLALAPPSGVISAEPSMGH